MLVVPKDTLAPDWSFDGSSIARMTEESTGRRLLLVEDEPLVAMMLQDMLGEAGYAVIGPIGQLDSAIEAAQQSAIDVALLDVNLMGKHVYPVAAVLAARGIPFLFMSGYGDGSLPPEYAGRPTVAKPYKMNALLDALAALPAKTGEGA